MILTTSAALNLDPSKCDTNELTCFKQPSNCDISFDNNCAIIAWENEDTNNLKFYINRNVGSASNTGYVGFAIGNSNNMGDGDTYICEKGSSGSLPELNTYWMTGKRRPTKFTNNNIDSQLITTEFENNIMECTFVRPDVPSDQGSYTLSTVMAQIVCEKLTSWKYSKTEIIKKTSRF